MSAIGMMDGAFFVGRKEIMDWINNTLDLNLDKVEDTASGAVACQLLDIMHPNTVPMHKVNWSANKDFEYIANYKVLQTCFSKLHIDKFVDVDRLIRGKYQDNLEFMQWFKRFFEMQVADKGDYNAALQRSKGKGGSDYGNRLSSTKPVTNAAAPSAAKSTVVKQEIRKVPAPTVTAAPVKRVPLAEKENPVNVPAPKNILSEKTLINSSTNAPAASGPLLAEIASLKKENEGLKKDLAEVKSEIEGLSTEKDFYFDKLREVEMMLQEIEDAGNGNDLTSAIFKILYATADGFEAQNESEKSKTLDKSLGTIDENLAPNTVFNNAVMQTVN